MVALLGRGTLCYGSDTDVYPREFGIAPDLRKSFTWTSNAFSPKGAFGARFGPGLRPRPSAQAFGLQRLPIVRATSHLPPGLKHPNLLTRMLQVFPLDPPPWLPKVTISGQQNAPTSRFSALLAPFSPGPFAHLPWPCQLDDSTRRETAPIHDSMRHAHC